MSLEHFGPNASLSRYLLFLLRKKVFFHNTLSYIIVKINNRQLGTIVLLKYGDVIGPILQRQLLDLKA